MNSQCLQLSDQTGEEALLLQVLWRFEETNILALNPSQPGCSFHPRHSDSPNLQSFISTAFSYSFTVLLLCLHQ